MGYKRGEVIMVIRQTPLDITPYWIVENECENLILQSNGLSPKYMDEKFSYYFIDDNFLTGYLRCINVYESCEKRADDFKNILRKV